MSNLGAESIRRVFVLQAVMTSVITVGLYFARSGNEAASAFLGGLVAILSALSFAKVLFRHRGARLAKKIVNDFYRGEAVKIGFASLLFALVFRFYRVSPMVFFITYSAMAMSFGFLLLIFGRGPRRGA